MIHSIYEKLASTASDINEHLPTLKRYAELCDHVTEMGVRSGCSTYALLSAKPRKVISYDIFEHSEVNRIKSLCVTERLDFDFRLQDVLQANIEQTDLLFIDTWHTYGQLKEELRLHSSKVSKYIILHDTVTFGYVDEPRYGESHQTSIPLRKEKTGLNPAIEEFLAENLEWKTHEVFTNNNGLTILIKSK